MTKGELRAQEYRARARDAWALVEGSALEHVREQRRRCAVAWTDMADAEEARVRSLRDRPPRTTADPRGHGARDALVAGVATDAGANRNANG